MFNSGFISRYIHSFLILKSKDRKLNFINAYEFDFDLNFIIDKEDGYIIITEYKISSAECYGTTFESDNLKSKIFKIFFKNIK